jgi:5-methylcytosine-specific restriction endonuclease McrA
MEQTIRTCVRCGEEKAADDFHLVAKGNTKRRAHCKACHRQQLMRHDRWPKRWGPGSNYAPWHKVANHLRKRGATQISIPAMRRVIGEPAECYLCGVPLTAQSASIDHVVPFARGGTHDYDNLRWACRPCNNAKDVLSVEEYVALARRVAAFNQP